MTASEVIVACCSIGVRLYVENGKLVVSDPRRLMSEKFKYEIARNEVELARMLKTQPTVEMAAMVAAGEAASEHEHYGSRSHSHHSHRPRRFSPVALAIGLLVLISAIVGVALYWFR